MLYHIKIIQYPNQNFFVVVFVAFDKRSNVEEHFAAAAAAEILDHLLSTEDISNVSRSV